MAEEMDKLEEMLRAKGFSGIGDIPKVLEALDSTKADLSKHKTRADAVSQMESELAQLRKAQQEREDAEKTEMQKLLDKMGKMQAEAESAQKQAAAAQRAAMLERGLSEHIGAIPEKLRPFASEHLRTVLPGKEWSDPETLKENITASMEKFNALLPEEMRTVPAGGQEQHRQTPMAPSADGPVTGFNYEDALRGGSKS